MLAGAMNSPLRKRGHQIEELIRAPDNVLDALGAKHLRTKPLASICNTVYGRFLPKGLAWPLPNEL